jgi:RND superfamily putative drug exporter
VIAPAVVTLLGDKAWWFPAWLDRILPNVSLEGHNVEIDEDGHATRKEPAPSPSS